MGSETRIEAGGRQMIDDPMVQLLKLTEEYITRRMDELEKRVAKLEGEK
jgi:hypothetical protein